MNQALQGKKIDELIAKAWSDDSFKKKLLSDPAATLKAEGVELPAGVSIKALENSEKVLHLVLPAKMTDGSEELSDEDLDQVAGGHAQRKARIVKQEPDIKDDIVDRQELRI